VHYSVRNPTVYHHPITSDDPYECVQIKEGGTDKK